MKLVNAKFFIGFLMIVGAKVSASETTPGVFVFFRSITPNAQELRVGETLTVKTVVSAPAGLDVTQCRGEILRKQSDTLPLHFDSCIVRSLGSDLFELELSRAFAQTMAGAENQFAEFGRVRVFVRGEEGQELASPMGDVDFRVHTNEKALYLTFGADIEKGKLWEAGEEFTLHSKSYAWNGGFEDGQHGRPVAAVVHVTLYGATIEQRKEILDLTTEPHPEAFLQEVRYWRDTPPSGRGSFGFYDLKFRVPEEWPAHFEDAVIPLIEVLYEDGTRTYSSRPWEMKFIRP